MIKPEDTIEDVITKYPKTVKIFMNFGIPCMVCGEPIWGTIKENAEKYGVKELDELIKALNEEANKQEMFFIKKELK